MAKLATTTLFKTSAPRAETLMDKITRAATKILYEETEQRKVKTERLRKARLERELACRPKRPRQRPMEQARSPGPRPPNRAETRQKPNTAGVQIRTGTPVPTYESFPLATL